MDAQARAPLAWTPEHLADPHAVADKPRRVEAMFARLARRYDLANTIHSFGMDRLWRRAAVRAAAVRPEDRALDVACGTGKLAAALRAAGAAEVIGLDAVPEMLDVARRRCAAAGIAFVRGDAMALPFPDGRFDVVTIGFGLRNLSDPHAALAQMHRVLAPGGRLVVLEFAVPGGRLMGAFSRGFIRHVIPVSGALITGDRSGAYRYLARSVDTYFTFDRLREAMSAAGFAGVRTVRTFGFGAVGVHVGVRP